MSGLHRVNLDSVRKGAGGSAWRNVNRASCGDIEVVGDGYIIVAIAKMMIEAGMTGDMEVYRGEMPVFARAPISAWAQNKALRGGDQPEHLRRKDGSE